MLQTIRDKTHGWIAGIVISLVILSFALWGIHSYIASTANNFIVAKVNGAEITKSQLAGAYERIRRQTQANMGSGNLPEAVETDLKVKALNALINVQVLTQGSLSEHYRVSSRQIDGYLESMPEFQVNGRFSMARLRQFLNTTLLNDKDFLDLIRSDLLMEQPRLGIIFSSFALPNEINSTVALVNQERDISYLILPKDEFLKQVGTISASAIQAYYDAHQSDFKTAEQVSVEYVELALNDLMKAIHPTEDEMKAFYNDNVNTYTLPMQWKVASTTVPLAETASDQDIEKAQKDANAIHDQLESGKNLGAQAKTMEDKANQRWISLNQVATDLQKAVSSLTQAGQVSDPVRTATGITIYKVYEIKQPQVQAYAAVKDKVAEAVTRQKAEEKYSDLRDKLANMTYNEHPDTLEPAAKALGLTIKTTEVFTQDKGGKDISSNKKVREAAFSADVLASQNNSDLIQLSPEDSIVLRTKTHVPASLLALSTVQKQIIDQLTTQAAQAKAESIANEVKLKLQSGISPEQIATEHHANWISLGYIGRYSTKVDPAILYAAFQMPRPLKATNVSYATSKIPNGYAIVALKGVQDGKIDNKQDQYDVFAEQVQNSEAILEYKLYEQSLMSHAKVISYLTSGSDQ